MLQIDRNTGRTQDWTARSFVTCLARLSIILCYSDSALFKKGCLKSFLKAKVKSPIIKCINHGFQSAAIVSAVGFAVLCCVVTHVFRSNRGQSLTLNYWSRCYKSHWYISWIQFKREFNTEYSGVWNEQFYWHFLSKLCRRKKTKLQNVISLVLPRVPSYFKCRVKEQNLFW